MTKLEEYYNKFNEDKRLLSRHGQVEFNTTFEYIHRMIDEIPAKNKKDIKIIDIGAGTGRYSLALAKEGYDVTSVELVKYNLGILKKHAREMDISEDNLKAYQGNALKLRKFKDDSFDIVIFLGPMYHLHGNEDKIQALLEAKRVLKKGGFLLAGYVMADYAVIRHGFMDRNIINSKESGAINDNFEIPSDENELYDYVRISDIDYLNEKAELKRKLIFAPDGAADYIRNILNEMAEEEFELFKEYQLKNAERPELLGASSHTVDILFK